MRHKRFTTSSTNTSSYFRRRYLPRLIVIAKILLLLFAAYSLITLIPSLLKIRRISCVVENSSCPTQVTSLLSGYLGKSLITLDRTKLKETITEVVKPESLQIDSRLSGELTVRMRLTSFNLPVLLYNLEVSENDAIDQLLLDQINISIANLTGTPKNLTRDGILIEGTGSSNLYIINPDNHSSSSLVSFSTVVSQLSVSNISIQAAYLLPQGVVCYLSSNQAVIFSLEKPAVEQINALQQILSTATIKTSQLIDLRFNRPVVK